MRFSNIMLCQKCGRQEAIINLESTVFRQKIEEHLCSLCAGDRSSCLVDTNSKGIGDTTSKELSEIVRSLIRSSKTLGYLNHEDVKKAMSGVTQDPTEIDEVLSILRNLEISVI